MEITITTLQDPEGHRLGSGGPDCPWGQFLSLVFGRLRGLLSLGFLYVKLKSLQVGWSQLRYPTLGRAVGAFPERIY